MNVLILGECERFIAYASFHHVISKFVSCSFLYFGFYMQPLSGNDDVTNFMFANIVVL